MSGEHDVIVFSYGHDWKWECGDCIAQGGPWPLDKVNDALDQADQHRQATGAGDAS